MNDVQAAATGTLAGVAQGVSGLAGIIGGATVSATVQSSLLAVGAVGNLAGAVMQSGYLNRATTNLTNASS